MSKVDTDSLRIGDTVYVRCPVDVPEHNLVADRVYKGEIVDTPAESGCKVPAFKLDDEDLWYLVLHSPWGDCALGGDDWIDATEEEYNEQD